MNANPVAETTQADREKLVKTIRWLDALTQRGCGRIESTGRVLLAAMKTPELYRGAGIADVAIVVRSMVDYAAELANDINCNAENVGANAPRDRDDDDYQAVVSAWQEAATIEAAGTIATGAKGGEA